MADKNYVKLVMQDLRFRERLLQTWGLTWQEAAETIQEAVQEWQEADRLQVPKVFVGESGYRKVDEG